MQGFNSLAQIHTELISLKLSFQKFLSCSDKLKKIEAVL